MISGREDKRRFVVQETTLEIKLHIDRGEVTRFVIGTNDA
jgi:hypothetical protein